jgi:hypothetical protein
MMKLNVTTNQQAFDAVVEHLAGMKGRSVRQDAILPASCSYRGANGQRCAIGALIPRFVGGDWGTVYDLVDQHRLDPGDVNVVLLRKLQKVHDSLNNWVGDRFDNWQALIEIGLEYGLVVQLANYRLIEKVLA